MCRINGRRTLQAEKLHIFSSACIKWLVPTVLCGNLCLCVVTAGTASLDKQLTRNRGLSPSTHSYKHALRPHIKTSGRKEVRDKYILLPESTLTLNFQVHTNTIWAYFTCVRPSHTIPLSCSVYNCQSQSYEAGWTAKINKYDRVEQGVGKSPTYWGHPHSNIVFLFKFSTRFFQEEGGAELKQAEDRVQLHWGVQ